MYMYVLQQGPGGFHIAILEIYTWLKTSGRVVGTQMGGGDVKGHEETHKHVLCSSLNTQNSAELNFLTHLIVHSNLSFLLLS